MKKKVFSVFVLSLLLVACGNSSKVKEVDKVTDEDTKITVDKDKVSELVIPIRDEGDKKDDIKNRKDVEGEKETEIKKEEKEIKISSTANKSKKVVENKTSQVASGKVTEKVQPKPVPKPAPKPQPKPTPKPQPVAPKPQPKPTPAPAPKPAGPHRPPLSERWKCEYGICPNGFNFRNIERYPTDGEPLIMGSRHIGFEEWKWVPQSPYERVFWTEAEAKNYFQNDKGLEEAAFSDKYNRISWASEHSNKGVIYVVYCRN